MSEDLRPPLSEHIRRVLIRRYGSFTNAARELGISIDRIKKAIQRNSFAGADLENFLPCSTYEELQAQFTFKMARKYCGAGIKKACSPILEAVGEQDWQFIKQNRAVEERIVHLIQMECARFREILSS